MTQTPGKGIGVDGMTLREMWDKKERLYRETGCYCGLKDLPLMREDPMKLEVLASRLLAAAIAGRETTRMISASPIVREVAELAVAIYTPEGDCIMQSTGIIIHIPLMGQVVEWMIREDYEHESGISEGDCFTSNDNYIAGMHPADIYDIMPIFWQEQLVGWVGTVIMEPEQGALAPGCMPSGATERFVEGLRFSAEKTAVNDRHLKSFERRIRLGCRMSDLFLLDRKGAMAADIKVRDEIKKIIDEVGIGFYMSGTRELIEIERRAQLERVRKRTVPGKSHSVTAYELYLGRSLAPPHHAIDRITLVPCDFHIRPDGTYFLDFDGAGSWGWHASNITPSALTGTMCMLLGTTIAYNGRANQGSVLTVEMNTPVDTFVNPTSPNIASSMFFAWPCNGGALWIGQQSRAFFSRGFLEEFRSPAPMIVSSGTVGALAGRSHWGMDFGFFLTEQGCLGGSGGFAIRDGITSDPVFIAESDMGNAEVWELVLPLLWLGRRYIPDACGWGKYRSGHTVMGTYMVYNTNLVSLDSSPAGHAEKIGCNSGMYGGYPGQPSFCKIVMGANTAELIQQRKPLVHGATRPGVIDIDVNVSGQICIPEMNSYVSTIATHGDLIQNFNGGGAGGVGDPLQRQPALAKSDLDSGLISPDRCRRIYGIEADYDKDREEWIIDEARTEQLREAMRNERLRKGIPAREWWQTRRANMLNGDLPPLLKSMYADSLNKGNRWSHEFRAFWHLPDDFALQGGL